MSAEMKNPGLVDLRDKVLVSKDWIEWVQSSLLKFTEQRCHLCNGVRITVKPGDESFYPRKGCLDCDVWLEDLVRK
jgi:hypothetical protein